MKFWRFTILILVVLMVIPHSTIAIELGGIGGHPADGTDIDEKNRTWFTYTLQPGQSKEDVLEVTNNTNEAVTLLLYPADSTTSSEGGYAVEQFVEARDQIGAWIQLSQSEVVVAPLTTVAVPFTISLPKTATLSAGDYTGGIMIDNKNKPTSNENGLVLATRVGVRVYVTIPGEIIEMVTLDEVTVQPLVDNPRVLDIALTVTNNGNLTEDIILLAAVDTVAPWPRWTSRGQKMPYQQAVNLQVLRGDTAVKHITIEKPWFGEFTFQGSGQYNSLTGQVMLQPVITQYRAIPSWYAITTVAAGLIISGGLLLAFFRKKAKFL